MMYSMTAYARCDFDIDGIYGTWEVRSVNHRYLDLVVNLPGVARELEPQIRRIAQRQIKRGKVDFFLTFKDANLLQNLTVDNSSVQAIAAACRQIATHLSDCAKVSPLDVLAWPGVVGQQSLGSKLQKALITYLQIATDELLAQRSAEGEKLHKVIEVKVDRIQSIIDEMVKELVGEKARQQDKLNTSISDLSATVDQNRLEQEVLYLLQKQDVTEELDRMKCHTMEVMKTLTSDGQIGRKLDFFMQEMHREANTIAAKVSNYNVSLLAIDLRLQIEQCREQAQNIE